MIDPFQRIWSMNAEEQRTSCPGFLDEYGIWNNGFECPPLGNQLRICCGSESRRYCCTLGTVRTSLLSDTTKFTTIKTTQSLIEKFQSNRFTLPILFSCLLILILFIISILIWIFLCHCSRRRWQQRRKRREEKSIDDQSASGKQALLVDHFPFSPPHHQLFFNDTHHPSTSHTHPQTRDTLTTNLAPSTLASTSSTSTSSVRVPSDIYFHDWKEFFVPTEQPLNMYPTISSRQNTLNKDPTLLHHSYRFHDYCEQDDIIV